MYEIVVSKKYISNGLSSTPLLRFARSVVGLITLFSCLFERIIIRGDENESEPPSFPEFNSQIEEALATLGGAVFAKLNWSAPRDAAWMGVGHSLKCESLTQIW